MVQRYRTLVDILISIYTSLTPDPAKVAEIQPIHIFMEFGTTRPLMMDLLGLGFARGTAIELAEQIEALKFKYEDSNQILEWLVKQQRSTIKSWKLSPEAWLEIALVSNRDPNEIDWTPPPEKSTPKS
jgi:hypothetical protein